MKFWHSLMFCLVALVISSDAQSVPAPGVPAKQPEITQSENVVHLAVNGPRPLADALDALQRKYEWLLNYEDPQFGKADIVESKNARYVNQASGAKPHIPNGSAFNVDFPAGTGSEPDAAKTLQLVLDAYNKSNNPGHFELRTQDQRFDIIGISAHDESGKIVQQNSPFDRSVTLPAGEAPAIDQVISICQQAGKLSDETINVGVFPRNVLDHTPVNIGAIKLSARDALAKVLSATGKKLFWRLLYDPDTKSYFLNLHLLK